MTTAAWFSALALAAAAEVAPPPPPPPPPPPVASAPAAAPAPQATLVPVTPEKDPRALALLQKMSDRLRTARTFKVKLRTTVEQATGGLLSSAFNKGTLEMERPNRVAATREGDLPEFHFVYDGKTMTVAVPGAGQWATAAAPPTTTAMLVAAAEQGDLSLPMDELLVEDPFATLTKDLVHAAYLGQVSVDGTKADHLVLLAGGVEIQYWLDATSGLPLREAMVYADHVLRPHYLVEYSDWKLNHRIREKTFELPKPKGATQVDFRTAAAVFR
jgi:hypothetical protein